MATCKDCLQNCPEIISDQCVQYTGPQLPSPLNVCTGDQLPVYEANIAAALLNVINGTGAMPTVTITTCTWFQQLFGVLSPNLNNILQILINGECSLYNMITALTTQVNSAQNGSVIDIGCLTGLPTTPTIPQIVQAIILLLCGINTTVNSFPSTYVRVSDLTTLITPIVNNIINNANGGTSQANAKMVPFTAIPYFGPLSNFDSTGKGITNLGFDKVYLCNGNNGTPDIRGRVIVSAIRSVPGPALDPAVDPAINPNNPNWALNDKNGLTEVALSVPQLPSHTHSVIDPGHVHNYQYPSGDNFSGNKFNAAKSTPSITQTTSSATTGISIAATGGSQAHTNIQPSIGAYHIMYIP